jgi:hypothetical protein
LNHGYLRFARARVYIPAMNELAYWTTKLQEAERELEAAATRKRRRCCRETIDTDQSRAESA